ncbi:MAG: beta-lactamase family protein [Caldilineaceae bacterium]|nr:beta-lactamase family protein [Caldilineaceae bacterium]
MSATGVPGAAVGIIHNGQRHTAAAGITNHDHPLPVTADTLFQIGSITKTMTATVAMRFVEAGRLDLDTPIQHYLPQFQLQDETAATQATMRHLLTHMGGWVGDYFENTGAGDDALARYVAKMADLPQQVPLGTLWSYNNAGFSLAGHVLEAIADKPYETIVQEELFDPLGMTMSFFFPGDVMVHRFAVGHTVIESVDGTRSTTVATPWPLARSANAAGAVTATVNDMLDYAQFHLQHGRTNEGKQWLQAATVDAMQRPLAKAGAMASHVGISWLLNEINGIWTVGHGGATNGQIAQLLLVPSRAFALVILTNANRGRELTRDLSKWALDHFLDLAAPEPLPQPIASEGLQPYTGYYQAQLSDVAVSADEQSLLLQVIPKGGFPEKDSPPGPQPPIARATFVATDELLLIDGPSRGARAEFLRADDGTLAWLRLGGRIHKRQP